LVTCYLFIFFVKKTNNFAEPVVVDHLVAAELAEVEFVVVLEEVEFVVVQEEVEIAAELVAVPVRAGIVKSSVKESP
jgi:hypothetical protein